MFLGLSLITLGLGLILSFSYLNKKINPFLINYAEVEIKRLSNLIINKAISEVISDDLKIEELLIIEKDHKNEIQTIDFNPLYVNKILTTVNRKVQFNLKNIIKGKIDQIDLIIEELEDYDLKKMGHGIIFEIPSGAIFNNTLLANLGPRIPVRFELIGEVVSNISTQITNYGINNAMMEISIKIELNEQVILPFVSKKIVYSVQTPVAIKLIQGVVPNYYFNGLSKDSPNVFIPIE